MYSATTDYIEHTCGTLESLIEIASKNMDCELEQLRRTIVDQITTPFREALEEAMSDAKKTFVI